jgi:hypothetical protein
VCWPPGGGQPQHGQSFSFACFGGGGTGCNTKSSLGSVIQMASTAWASEARVAFAFNTCKRGPPSNRFAVACAGAKNNYMLGSFGPKADLQTAMTPWDEVGMRRITCGPALVRGHGTMHLRWIGRCRRG